MKPVFTIISINFNNAAALEKTIQSVLGQTFRNFEYLVIDGGSKDSSPEILQKYSDRLAYWVSEPDKGVYDAQNKGRARARGEYCLFLNSGDEFYGPTVLQEVVEAGMEADIIYGSLALDTGSGQLQIRHMPETLSLAHMVRDTLWHPVSFIRTRLFDQFGPYRLDLKIVSDYEWFLKVLMIHQVSSRRIPVVISVFSLDGMSSLPENAPRIKAEREKVQLELFGGPVFQLFQDFLQLEGQWTLSRRPWARKILDFFKAKVKRWVKRK